MRLFAHWHLSHAEQAGLLGLATADESCLVRFRVESQSGINPDSKIRVGHLLAIHQLLRALFPGDRDLAYRWPTTPNNPFNGQIPVAVIQEQGLPGMLLVRRYLVRAAAADHPKP